MNDVTYHFCVLFFLIPFEPNQYLTLELKAFCTQD